ncbi:nitric oxide response protein [Metallosphaera tengchongensis]|uniref:Nitric oxide response protein n=1 Tax=Metallosphaera tengchongensis TaxID=1532350 RepID=A0A6N0NV40_9CREN|nr:nitric oxide response protein [Metallosphaera tengchongensis]QKQ99069.1 nitric oxide response protein [Metallosphaera tengchongensis]
MKLSNLALLIEGISFLLIGGIPAVFNFMDMQGFPYPLPTSLFNAHWIVMVYGFFLTLIGNEILVALSNEWRGRPAPKVYIAVTGVSALIAVIMSELNLIPYSLYVLLLPIGTLIFYSRVYLSPSKLGLKPTTYNYLLFITLIITVFVISFQTVMDIPWVSLVFPSLTIFAIMSRDIGLVFGGKKINGEEMTLAYLSLLLGIVTYPTYASSLFLFLSWVFSLHGSGILRSKGRLYPRVSLSIAWTWLLLSSLFSLLSYDAFVHSIAVGFLFDTVFGVDAVLMDMLIGISGKRLSIRPSYLPIILLNIGLSMRIAYDLGISSSLFIASAPLQGIGILSFYLNVFRQVLPQLKSSV